MDAKELEKIVEKKSYADAHILKMETKNLMKEVKIIYDYTEDEVVIVTFNGCCKVHFDHDNNYPKGMKVKDQHFSQYLYMGV